MMALLANCSDHGQWWPAPIVIDAVTYPTAEHWMMAEKARLFDDVNGRDSLRA